MPDCIPLLAANDFLSKDANRISGQIARSLAINSPWMNVFETGTFQSGVSDIQRSVRQEAIAPVLSQATPNWAPFACTKTPTDVTTGSTEFQYHPLSHLERGPKICVTQAFSAFRNAIRMAEMAINDHVQTLWNSWLRYQAYVNSATKVLVNSHLSLNQMISTGYQTPFITGYAPDSPLSWRFLKAVANYATHVLLAGDEFKFGTGGMKHFRFISDQDTIDSLRRQADVIAAQYAIASSGDSDAKASLRNFFWDGPYQGIAFAIDQSITRCSGINEATGVPNFIEPFVALPTTRGVQRSFNQTWLNAPYQISFLVARRSFVREIPEEFLGEGMTKFERQFWGGRVVWHNQKDNDCNIKGDTGFHYYDLAAAMRPERPEFVIPIIHTRCSESLCLTPCVPQGYYSNSV